ncbi:sensor histidine kinase [Psychrobacter sp. H7-1]|uniref:sensor histidine kinase n=1 Tax=Psychrobacter sp. H7-1 TaxID=1569265 RepID=UPI0019182A09|nr:ATP-binding protein [Psychrobacter sp. H7-1]
MSNSTTKPPLHHKLNQPLTLFWRLFLSMLTILLLTSALSVGIERWMNAKELNNRMQLQIARLLVARQNTMAALSEDDLDTVRQLYRDERWLMAQMRIIDQQGQILFPKFGRFRSEHEPLGSPSPPDRDSHSRPPPELPPPLSEPSWQQVSADVLNYPELQDTTVTSASGQTYTVQLQPRLSLRDLASLRKDHTLIRVVLILVFSILVCYWLSQALTRRIHRLQKAVHLMSEGRFKAGEELTDLGNDELGALAKDVSKLSTRLADSELARKQMLSDISHELRSPLARLEVATELTRDFAPEASHYLDRIEKESARMNELIEHIIRIQSLQMRQYALDIEAYQPVNLYALLDEIREDVCFEFQDKGVTWQWQTSPTILGLSTSSHPKPSAVSSNYRSDSSHESRSAAISRQATAYTLLGDQEQLHSAFENIIRNAYTHTAPNSVVTVVLQSIIDEKTKNPAIKLQVMDAGDGVADTDLQRIFQPFVRLSASRERLSQTPTASVNSPQKYSGYGLGLAIAHAIVIAHQGRLVAYNRQDGHSGLVIEAILPIHSTLES